MNKMAHVGADYHLDSLSIAVLVDGEKDFCEAIHLRNTDPMIAKYLGKQSKKYELKLCYEASSRGYAFQRKVKG